MKYFATVLLLSITSLANIKMQCDLQKRIGTSVSISTKSLVYTRDVNHVCVCCF